MRMDGDQLRDASTQALPGVEGVLSTLEHVFLKRFSSRNMTLKSASVEQVECHDLMNFLEGRGKRIIIGIMY